MRRRVWSVCLWSMLGATVAGQGVPAQQGAGRGPTQTAPGGLPSGPAPTGATTAGSTVPPPVVARTFSGAVGLAFNTVRPERVTDFETLLAEVQQALARSKTPSTQAQAKAWRFFKATESGPNGSVMYVFVIDPVAPGEDYSLGKVLVDAIPDAAKLQELWKLYTSSVTGGGTLLNLSPVSAVPPAPGARGRGTAPTEDTLPRMLPPDRDPTRQPAP